jgi:hypothetical protein
METEKKKIDMNKVYMIGGGVAVLVIIFLVVGLLMTKGKSAPQAITTGGTAKTAEEQDQEKVVPTVDASVVVNLKPTNGKKEITLTVQAIPTGTETIDYELSYETESQGLQGVMGTATLTSKDKELQKQLTLGTCSSGKCVYHQVVGDIKVSLKFNGSYGEKMFEKNFSL